MLFPELSKRFPDVSKTKIDKILSEHCDYVLHGVECAHQVHARALGLGSLAQFEWNALSTSRDLICFLD